MNKDVIYIEPEDDITDIINRLSASKQKVVALVPPKNLGLLRSAVNTKLISKTAKKQEKVAVFVTTDKSLMKLAMTAGIPVAKTLQSRPVVPTPEDLADKPSQGDEVIEEEDPAPEPEKPAKSAPASKSKKSEDVETLNSADIDKDLAKDEKPASKSKKSADKSKKGEKVPTLDKYRKRIIIGASAGVVLIIFLIWAIVFAPAAKIIVAMHTTANAFSENVTLVTNQKSSDTSAGKLYIEKQEEKSTASVSFQATGKKNVGEHASGTLTVSAAFDDAGSVNVPAGTTFTYNGLAYTSENDASLSWDGDSIKSCDNGNRTSVGADGCIKSASVRISANESGEKYNVSASASGWHSSVSGISAANSSAISGGTDKTVTIVQQADIDAAKEKLVSDSKIDKSALSKKFSENYLTIDSSYNEDTSDAVASPAAGEEVGDGVTPKLEMTTTVSMYGVDKTTVEKFIKAKSKDSIGADQKIYSYGDPFFEKFTTTDADGEFSAKLKTTTQVGPEVTEEEVVEKTKGKKIGEVQTLLKSINGVSSVSVEKSFFWVNSIPDDKSKITVELKVEE